MSRRTEILEIARLLEEHRGEETVALDVRGMSSWTDYFVITTVHSMTHLGGLLRALDGYLEAHAIEPLHGDRRTSRDGWVLLDCGDFVVHLMSRELRDFYQLERLYFRGEVIDHSSKSS
jgi:ribosome-associated protein